MVEEVLHIAQEAFVWQADPSSPSDCMGQVVGKDTVEVHLACSVHTCCYYCTLEVVGSVLVDIDPLIGAHQGSMVLMLLVPGQPYVLVEQPELVQLGLVVCSTPQLAAVVACLGRVID